MLPIVMLSCRHTISLLPRGNITRSLYLLLKSCAAIINEVNKPYSGLRIFTWSSKSVKALCMKSRNATIHLGVQFYVSSSLKIIRNVSSIIRCKYDLSK